jgi:hypothetical protein
MTNFVAFYTSAHFLLFAVVSDLQEFRHFATNYVRIQNIDIPARESFCSSGWLGEQENQSFASTD